jgi:transposase
MTTTIDNLAPDALWQPIQLLLPASPPRYGGRPRVDDHACLAGII